VISQNSDLSIENLYFSYPEYPGLPTRRLFNGLDLELAEAGIALLLARPDQGKTTLCRILGGLVPRFSGGSVEGRILLGNVRLLEHQPFDLLEQVGLVFQHPGEQLLLSRCDSEIAFALESLGISRSEIEARLEDALRVMDLERYRKESPKNLSGGEKKKLLVACLIAINPQLWLLDETLEELDSDTKTSLLRMLKRRQRTTLILSAKWHELFQEYVDQVFLMEDGKVLRIQHPIGSSEFRDLILRRGFILPIEDLPGRGKTLQPSSPQPPMAQARGAKTLKAESREGEFLLEASDLFFEYEPDPSREGSTFSLQIESLKLQAGKTLALVGDNGSGKSTLGRILCGLLTPKEGTIEIRKNGRLQPAAEDALNRFTGYLFQDPDLQIFLPTVFEELALGLKHLHLEAEEISRRVEEAISLFNLPVTDSPPSLMSYGARKQLQAGVYYLLERPLMIIDEGDSGLGVNDFAEMVRVFQEPGRSLLFITHDHRLAQVLADEVLELNNGRLL
jgi:energy-coupling factor transport system ATP-binding protein